MHELALFAPSRIPPKEIRDRLRQEVNFGCPICRSPFLTFHHFDPLWEPEHRHYEPGMIALCAEHHNFADGGNYSKDQLHNLKSNPPNTPPKGLLPWNSPSFFVMFGGNYYVIAPGKRFSFRVMGDEVFSFSQTSDKLFALNATIWNRHRNIVAKIEKKTSLSIAN